MDCNAQRRGRGFGGGVGFWWVGGVPVPSARGSRGGDGGGKMVDERSAAVRLWVDLDPGGVARQLNGGGGERGGFGGGGLKCFDGPGESDRGVGRVGQRRDQVIANERGLALPVIGEDGVDLLLDAPETKGVDGGLALLFRPDSTRPAAEMIDERFDLVSINQGGIE